MDGIPLPKVDVRGSPSLQGRWTNQRRRRRGSPVQNLRPPHSHRSDLLQNPPSSHFPRIPCWNSSFSKPRRSLQLGNTRMTDSPRETLVSYFITRFLHFLLHHTVAWPVRHCGCTPPPLIHPSSVISSFSPHTHIYLFQATEGIEEKRNRTDAYTHILYAYANGLQGTTTTERIEQSVSPGLNLVPFLPPASCTIPKIGHPGPPPTTSTAASFGLWSLSG